MAGKIYTRTKMQGLQQVAQALFDDLKLAGLTQKLPAANGGLIVTSGSAKFLFESSEAVNPLQATQPWRILVDLEGATGQAGRLRIAIANPFQLPDAGTTTTFPGATDATGTRIMGQLGSTWNRSSNGVLGDCFITRNVTNRVYDAGTTLSSLLVATPRGIFFHVWEESAEEAPMHSMFCVQVPVNKDTGVPMNADKSPIFCVYNSDNSGFKKFIVSESDVFRPTKSVTAESNTLNSAAIINAEDQVSIARGNRYLLTLPNRLNTDRFAYTEELDMFGYVSADVIGEGSEISVTLYDEGTPRVYRALKATGPNNTKVRVLALVENGGVPNA